jgi:hypothetical protein
MQRIIAHAYDALWAAHERVRAVCMKILAQDDGTLERKLMRATPDDGAQYEEVLLYEKPLSGPQRRRISSLNIFRWKLERLMDALLKL